VGIKGRKSVPTCHYINQLGTQQGQWLVMDSMIQWDIEGMLWHFLQSMIQLDITQEHQME
jgi:hypothetical protein